MTCPPCYPLHLQRNQSCLNYRDFLWGEAIDAAAPLQDSLRLILDKFTSNYRNLFEFTDYEPSIIEILEPVIIQYSSYEVFREAELLEQITVPEDEQVVLDEYEVIAIPEERTLENLDKFTSNYRNLFEFTDYEPSIIEILEPVIIQYSSYEVFREAELLEQITVPEDEQVVLDEYEVIAIPEERTLENLDKFTSNYRNLFEFTDYKPSIIEILDPDIIQYSSYEVFREAELLEQITVPEDEQVDLDEYEIIAIPEKRTLEDWLGKFNLDFPTLLQGARAALNTDNPDRARHVASSLRELIGHILRQLAPEDKIRGWNTDPSYYHNSRPTRKARLLYLCREFDFAPLSKFVDADVKSAIYLIEALNAETHVISRRLTDRQLQALVDGTESCLLFLLRLNSANE